MKLFNKTWWKAAGVRAIKTFAQTMLVNLIIGVPFFDMQWLYALSVSVGAALVSLLTSLAGLPELEADDGH